MMSPFIISVTLAALVGPEVFFVTPQLEFKDQAACDLAVVHVEETVQIIVARDPDALAYFGNVAGTPTRAYFVKDADCEGDEE
jgi:hypothetical protein